MILTNIGSFLYDLACLFVEAKNEGCSKGSALTFGTALFVGYFALRKVKMVSTAPSTPLREEETHRS